MIVGKCYLQSESIMPTGKVLLNQHQYANSDSEGKFKLNGSNSKPHLVHLAHPGPRQPSKMQRFAKLVNDFQLLAIFAKHPILDVSQGSEYTWCRCNQIQWLKSYLAGKSHPVSKATPTQKNQKQRPKSHLSKRQNHILQTKSYSLGIIRHS